MASARGRADKPPAARGLLARQWHQIRKHRSIFFLGVVLPLVIYILFVGYPIVYTLFLSTHQWDGFSTTVTSVGLQNYQDLLHDPDFWIATANTIKWTIGTLVFTNGIAFVLAVVLRSPRIYFGSFLRLLFFLPVTMSLVAIGLMFSFILTPAFGGLDVIARAVGFSSGPDLIGNPASALYTLIAVFGWSYLGIPLVLYDAGLTQIPVELYEAARLEGATSLQQLFLVTLPLMRPIFMVVTVLAVLEALRAFDLVLVMTRGGPGHASDTLGYFMWIQSFDERRFGYGAAISMVMLLLSSVLPFSTSSRRAAKCWGEASKVVRADRFSPQKVLSTAALLAVAATFAYPAFLTVVTSVKSQEAVLDAPLALPDHITFDAYTQSWHILGLGGLLLNSLFYAAVGAGIALLLAIYPAYAFSRFRFLGSRTVFLLLLTTQMLPQQTALIPLYDALTRLGLLNTRYGLVIIHAAWGMPLQILLLTGFLANQPRELEQAARIDGATDRQLLQYIVLPLALPAMAAGFLLNFVGIWKEFIFAITFLNSQTIYPLTTGIVKFTSSQYFTSFTLPAAAVVISQLPLLLLFLFTHRWLARGIYAGAVK